MIKLKVNGKNQQFDGDPETPLLWVLRDELDLKGTKYGCGMGMCGACTIHLNGSPVRACLTPVSAAANKSVTTIEGISPDGSHPVQVAWQELDVPQCGYCQAGQIMSACALLAKKAKPTSAATIQQDHHLRKSLGYRRALSVSYEFPETYLRAGSSSHLAQARGVTLRQHDPTSPEVEDEQPFLGRNVNRELSAHRPGAHCGTGLRKLTFN